MIRYTFVVEYEEGKEPSVGAATDILGGKLSFVAFNDIRDFQLTAEEAQALTMLTDESPDAFKDNCEEVDADPDSIIEKLYQQAI